jgi:ureidoglycolate lyase
MRYHLAMTDSSPISAQPLTSEAYAAFGEIVSARGQAAAANQGTAQRFNHLAELSNLRPKATTNVCMYRCTPAAKGDFTATLLERHAHSTQLFVPMNAARYLLIVAQGGTEPDLATVKAFIAGPDQGITYRPGIWHHPMVVLDREADMACWVCEDGTSEDCETRTLSAPLTIQLR